MRSWPILLALTGLPACVSMAPGSGLAGSYRLAEGPDAAGQLVLTPGGRFTYVLTAGALDEHAHGRWEQDGSAACLFTEPRPKPPVFTRTASAEATEPGKLLVTWPDGSGIAGVDFRLGFEDGSTLADYTQYDGWTTPPDDERAVRWIELAVPMHGLKSPRFEIAEQDRGPWHFTLTPNDLGIVDFRGECLKSVGDRYLLERDGGAMRFVRASD